MKVEKIPFKSQQEPKPEPSSEQTLSASAEREIHQGGNKETSKDSLTSDQELVDNSLLQPTFGKEWQKLDFDNAAKFAIFFQKSLREGKHTLYPWQIEELEKISFANASQQHPYKYVLCACNGSGKDLYFNSIVTLYFICCRIRFRFLVTSSSVRQLTEQTEKYIVSLANDINNVCSTMFGGPILKINQHHITCLLSGSEAILTVTDEEGKAEGYHPFDGGDMAILANESKSITPEIFRALRRCTGYSYFLLVSSPGEPKGDFYDAYVNWPNKRRITIFDCPHHARGEYEEDKRRLGEQDSYFRSKWLAAFTTVGGKSVLDLTALMECKRNSLAGKTKLIMQHAPIRVGIDIALSSHGDESVMAFWQGNKQLDQVYFKNKDATVVAEIIEKNLTEKQIHKSHEFIFADDGGVGRAVIDILQRRGWSIKRILNQSQARNTKQYRNRGAELWHRFARLVLAGIPVFINDEKLFSQLMGRKFKTSAASVDKLCLQSKEEMMSEGHPSPDRADATVLAFTGINIKEWLDAFELIEEPKVIKSQDDQFAEIAEQLWNGEFQPQKRGKIFGSLNKLMGRGRNQGQQVLVKWGL